MDLLFASVLRNMLITGKKSLQIVCIYKFLFVGKCKNEIYLFSFNSSVVLLILKPHSKYLN